MSNLDVLIQAAENGIIDIATIKQQNEMLNKTKYLKMHQFKIWQGDNSYWYTYLIIQGKRKLIKKKTKEDLENFIISYYKGEDPTISDIFYKVMNERLRIGDIEIGTFNRYESDFIRYFDKIRDNKIKYITEDYLETFIKETISSLNLTRKNWSNMRILVNMIFKYAKKHGDSNIVISIFMDELTLSKKLFKKVVKDNSTQVFTDEEVKKIFNYVDTNNNSILNLAIKFVLLTGLRAGEVSALKRSDINGYILNVTKTEVRYKKDNKYHFDIREYTKGSDGYRRVILTDEGVKTFNQIVKLNPNGLYLIELDGERVKAHGFSKKCKRICKNVGIPERSLHKCRKTYATTLLKNNVDEKLVTSQMGHTNIITTKEYYWFDNSAIEDDKDLLERIL